MSQAVAAPGFFGKVPGRGDFLVRRMPAGFQAAWEDWLSTFVVAARDGLREAWPTAWLTAPVWHFSLGADLVAPLGATGVLLASVDRVGRFFPWSIIGAASPASTMRPDDWAHTAEALLLASLEDDFEPDQLDARLCDLGPPPVVPGSDRPQGVWQLPIHEGWPARPADALADSAWLPPGAGQSVWWCRGSERMVPLHIRSEGLPNQRLAASMVTGQFDPADGGEAAADPTVLATAARPGREEPAPAAEADAAAVEPVMQVAASPGFDPLDFDPDWSGAATGGGQSPAELPDETMPGGAPEAATRPAPEEQAILTENDPLAFLEREDDPLADRPR